MSWRDHTNGMAVAQRAEAAADEFWATADGPMLDSLMTTLGHTCANAELERRRAAEAERDALKAERDAAAEAAAKLRMALAGVAEAVLRIPVSLAESAASTRLKGQS